MLGTPVSRADNRRYLAGPGPGDRSWLDFDGIDFDRDYNHRPFLLRHRLHETRLFDLPALRALARRMSPADVHYRFGRIPHDTPVDLSLARFSKGLTLDDALDRLEERSAYVALYNPERDPEYGPLIEELVAEVARRTARLDPEITWYSSYIFISAQQSVTPYHMDREMNFLLQVRGHKIVQLWDQADPTIMTDAEKDYLLASHAVDARPRYRPEFETKAMRYELLPGLGVHHPFIAPHLVRTGEQVSVSLALTWRSRASDTLTCAHRLNHGLRTMGLHPAAVGTHPRMDMAKATVVRGLRKAKRSLRAGFAGID